MDELTAIRHLAARLQEGGPGSGRHPSGAPKGIRGGQNKVMVPGGIMKISDVTYHIADPKKGLSMCGRGGKGGGPSQNTVVVPGGAKPSVADLNKVGCPRCLAKYTARNYRATETADLYGRVAAVEHRPDYGTFVIPPIDPDQQHARESFVSLIERQTQEYGTSDGAKKGWDVRGRATKGDKLDRTVANIKGQIGALKQGKPSTSIASKPGAPSVRDVASYWSATKHGGTLNAPKFTGQGKVGVSNLNKMNVLSRAQGQAIFSKAGAAKGFK
jgi:hypothetical protein